jgi:hypothetical protein
MIKRYCPVSGGLLSLFCAFSRSYKVRKDFKKMRQVTLDPVKGTKPYVLLKKTLQ